MGSVVFAARLVLAMVFATAAIGKLLDLSGSRASLVGFGLSERVASVLGTTLPFAELAVAVALVPRPSARWGAVGALVLLLAFVAGIANALRRGEAPPCNCFGAIHSAPASTNTLARNVVLAAIAGVAAGWGPGPAADDWVDARATAELVAVAVGLAACILAAVAIQAWVENRRLRRDLASADQQLTRLPPGLRVGSLAPEFSVPDGNGGRLTLASLLEHGRPVLLVFTVAGCGPCEPMLPMLRRLQAIAADRITIAPVGIHTIKRYDRARARHGGLPPLVEAVAEDPELGAELDELTEIARRYQMPNSPGAVLVTPAGTIGSTVVAGRPAIEALVRLSLAGGGDQPLAPASTAGSPRSR